MRVARGHVAAVSAANSINEHHIYSFIVVDRVSRESPAWSAGLLEGDIIERIGSITVSRDHTPGALEALMNSSK